jgi:vesicle-associated membrane protein 7
MLYSFVARGSIILSKYAACQGNFEQVALDCLEKLSGTESRFTVKAQEHMLHFLVDGGLTYLLVAEESCSREICFYYLEQVRASACSVTSQTRLLIMLKSAQPSE